MLAGLVLSSLPRLTLTMLPALIRPEGTESLTNFVGFCITTGIADIVGSLPVITFIALTFRHFFGPAPAGRANDIEQSS